jgi:hypothetical protein
MPITTFFHTAGPPGSAIVTTDRYTRERITDSLLTAREGLVPYADACEWLTNYPDKPTAPGSPPRDSLARSLGGAGLLGRVLDRLHGAPPAWESRGQSADYRPSAGGTLVSVAALAEAAREAENVPLLRLIQEAQAERAAVLGTVPKDEPEADTEQTEQEADTVQTEQEADSERIAAASEEAQAERAAVSGDGQPLPSTASTLPKPRRPGRDVMGVLIEREQSHCADPQDIAEVWGRLLALADSPQPPYPILGRDEGFVKWRADASDAVKFLNRDALSKRLKPRPPKR